MGGKSVSTFLDPLTGVKVKSGKVYGSGSEVLGEFVAELPEDKLAFELTKTTYSINVFYDTPEYGKWYQKWVYQGKFRVDKSGQVSGSVVRHFSGQYALTAPDFGVPLQERYYEERVRVDSLGRPASFKGSGGFRQAMGQFDYGDDYVYSSDNGGYFTDNSGASVPVATDKSLFSAFGASRFFGGNWWTDVF